MIMPTIRDKQGPEDILQDEIRKFLAVREWVTMRTHGNAFQRGFPDLYGLHHVYGARWIEIKHLDGSSAAFTKAQISTFPKISEAGHGVWIMTKPTEQEYAKLHLRENWKGYLIDPRIQTRGSDPSVLLYTLPGQNPEAILQNKIMEAMRKDGWNCLPTSGNLYQQGLPDFYALHPKHGGKWVEVKRRESYKFTGAQRKYFPLISAAGHQIWVLTAVSEIPLLEREPNWWQFMYGGLH